jgi:hypothetical protein
MICVPEFGFHAALVDVDPVAYSRSSQRGYLVLVEVRPPFMNTWNCTPVPVLFMV